MVSDVFCGIEYLGLSKPEETMTIPSGVEAYFFETRFAQSSSGTVAPDNRGRDFHPLPPLVRANSTQSNRLASGGSGTDTDSLYVEITASVSASMPASLSASGWGNR